MIVLVTGENDFGIQQTVGRYVQEFVGEPERFEGINLHPAQLADLLMGATLFAIHRLVIIRQLSANKALWSDMSQWLEQLSDQTDLILIEPHPDKRTKTYKWLQKHATLLDCSKLGEQDLMEWARVQASQRGIELHTAEAKFLIRYVGNDQWRLAGDIDKLALADSPITELLIRELVEPHPEATVFELLDSVMSGRRSEAKRHLATIRRSEDPYQFLGLLVSQLYALAVVIAATSQSVQGIAKDAGIHPYVVQKMMTSARRISPAQLRAMVNRVVEADAALKMTGADPWTSIEIALAQLEG